MLFCLWQKQCIGECMGEHSLTFEHPKLTEEYVEQVLHAALCILKYVLGASLTFILSRAV